MTNQYFLTQKGLQNLQKEHQTLVEVEKPKVVERVRKAREMGSLDDNPEYDAARDEQSRLEGRIWEIGEILAHAQIVEEQKKISGKISVGSTVTVEIEGEKQAFTIVGSVEADPALGKISHESPVGKSLLGLGEGDTVEVELPHGKFTYKILEIHS